MSKKSAGAAITGRKLQHVTKVVKPGRCFTWTTYELSAIREKARDRIRFTREFKAHLACWSIFINQWNGSSLIWDHLHHYPEVTVFSGLWGCGATTHSSIVDSTSMVAGN